MGRKERTLFVEPTAARRIADAGGVMDISRWRKPPVPHTICIEPRRGDGMFAARFPQPLAGAWANVHDPNRWLAPPANLQCPSGTIRIISSTNSPDAISSRRFEVKDFAKQIHTAQHFRWGSTS